MKLICLFNKRYDEDGIVSLYRGSERLNMKNSVPVWGSLSRFGPQLIEKINGRIDTKQYITFLKKVMKENEAKTPFNFVHDRYPVHRAKAVMEFFFENVGKIQPIPWPADFGDLMPLELVWEEIAEKMINKRGKISSEDFLWAEISRCWSELFQEEFYIGGLTYRIPSLLNKVFMNHGDWAIQRIST